MSRRGGAFFRGCALAISVGCAPDVAPSSTAGDAESSTTSTGDTTTSTECELPETPAGRERAIRLRNDSDHPIWITGVHSIFPFQLEGPAGPITSQIYGRCDSCSDVLEQGCDSWCEDHGDQIAIRVEPGGTFEEIWSGRLWETITLACESCDAQCDVASIAPDGDYVARATVLSNCIPEPGSALPGCECTPEANGACEIFRPAATFDDELEVEATFAWPGVDPVEIVLQ